MAIIPVNDPTSDDAGKDLVKPLLASIAALKSAKKSAAWVDEMLALREDAGKRQSGFARVFLPSFPCRIVILGLVELLPGCVKTAPCACN